jgi:hypothetical protein
MSPLRLQERHMNKPTPSKSDQLTNPLSVQEWDLLTKQFQDGNERASQEFENVKNVLATMNSGLGYAKELC